MTVLFFMSHGLFARNFETTLRELTRRGQRVHVALDWMEKAGVDRINEILAQCARDQGNLTYGLTPARRRVSLATAGRALRLGIDYLRYLEPAYAVAEKPRRRLEQRLPQAVRLATRPLERTSAGRAAVRHLLAAGAAAIPVRREVLEFVKGVAPDVAVITPLVDPASPQDEYVRAARALGVPTVLAVHSWDNLTIKGGIHTATDVVAVWNKAQETEATQLHGMPRERVVVTGATAYDDWFERGPTTGREAFCRDVGLDPALPFVLYVGSSPFIAPREGEFVREWVASLRAAEQSLADLQILVRPHPLNPLGWDDDVPKGVALQPGEEPVDAASRAAYFDAVYHSAAVVGILTSALIEAAIVGRPVHTIVVERYRDTQTATLHAAHLLPERGGMLNVARSYREHGQQLRASLRGGGTERNSAFLEAFVRPYGLSVPAAPRLVEVIENAARWHAAPGNGSPGTGRVSVHES